MRQVLDSVIKPAWRPSGFPLAKGFAGGRLPMSGLRNASGPCGWNASVLVVFILGFTSLFSHFIGDLVDSGPLARFGGRSTVDLRRLEAFRFLSHGTHLLWSDE